MGGPTPGPAGQRVGIHRQHRLAYPQPDSAHAALRTSLALPARTTPLVAANVSSLASDAGEESFHGFSSASSPVPPLPSGPSLVPSGSGQVVSEALQTSLPSTDQAIDMDLLMAIKAVVARALSSGHRTERVELEASSSPMGGAASLPKGTEVGHSSTGGPPLGLDWFAVPRCRCWMSCCDRGNVLPGGWVGFTAPLPLCRLPLAFVILQLVMLVRRLLRWP